MILEELRVLKMQSRVGADYNSFDDEHFQHLSCTCSDKMASEGLRNFG